MYDGYHIYQNISWNIKDILILNFTKCQELLCNLKKTVIFDAMKLFGWPKMAHIPVKIGFNFDLNLKVSKSKDWNLSYGNLLRTF